MLKLFTAYISNSRIDAYKECNEEINTFAKENHLKIANVQILNLTEYAAIEVLFEKDEQLEDKVIKLENETTSLKKEILFLKEESKEKQAEQEANIAAAQAQKIVKESEAKKQAAELDAQAEIAKAEGEAQAKKIRADADAYEAKRIAENQQAYQKQWDYEIAKIRAEKWNGVEVSNQSIYVPNTYDLKSGK